MKSRTVAVAAVSVCAISAGAIFAGAVRETLPRPRRVLAKPMGLSSTLHATLNGKSNAIQLRFIDTHFGGLDVLVNSAGVGVFRPVSELSIQDWQYTIDTNLSGVFYCCREALFRYETRGGGHIVNISSLAGKVAFAGGAAYNASKFALTGFSEAVMLDKRSDNVRVGCVMPGSVATEFGGSSTGTGADWKIWPEDVAEIVRMLLRIPARTLVSRVEVRAGEAEEIASARESKPNEEHPKEWQLSCL